MAPQETAGLDFYIKIWYNKIMKIKTIFDILEKYLTDNQKEYPFWAEHDVIGFNVDYELISKEDLQALEYLGIFISKDYYSLIMFV